MFDKTTLSLAVIIPLYNKELSVIRAVNSVLAQTLNFQELIIVNDGSTDNSLAVVEQINDPRIKIITQQNQGVSVARNNGVAATKAEYICFLDADDEWHPWFLEEIAALITINPKAGLFCARYEEVNEAGKNFVGKLSGLSEKFCGQLDDFFNTYRYNRSIICSSNSCINRQYFEELGGYPEQAKIGEDMYVWLNVALKAPVMFSSKISSRIYRNAENRSHIREKVTLPFHLQYFLNKKQQPLLAKNPTLKSFLLYNTTIFCLYASQKGDRKTAFSAASLLMAHSIFYSLLNFCGICLPRGCIELLKKLRNKKTLSYEK